MQQSSRRVTPRGEVLLNMVCARESHYSALSRKGSRVQYSGLKSSPQAPSNSSHELD